MTDTDCLLFNSPITTHRSQLEQSLAEVKKANGTVRLVSCGPLALRQYLFPAARRAQLKLSSPLFDSYLDLSREFESRFGRRLYHSSAGGTNSGHNNNHPHLLGSWSSARASMQQQQQLQQAHCTLAATKAPRQADGEPGAAAAAAADAVETLSQLRSKLAQMAALLVVAGAANNSNARGHLTPASAHQSSIGAVLRRVSEMLECE